MPEQRVKQIAVRKITNPTELEVAFAIRRQVFVDEQGCPPELERENEEVSHHFLAVLDKEPVGAARWRKTDQGYKLERFAVLSTARGTGVGAKLIKAVLEDLPTDAEYVYLNSQTQAVPFYLKMGFQTEGEEFEEAGIMHYKMVLNAIKGLSTAISIKGTDRISGRKILLRR